MSEDGGRNARARKEEEGDEGRRRRLRNTSDVRREEKEKGYAFNGTVVKSRGETRITRNRAQKRLLLLADATVHTFDRCVYALAFLVPYFAHAVTAENRDCMEGRGWTANEEKLAQ